jgi:hypothetical protein
MRLTLPVLSALSSLKRHGVTQAEERICHPQVNTSELYSTLSLRLSLQSQLKHKEIQRCAVVN